ncbi:hypothetical protein PVAG01_06573 [Phlyctema vagabunda]|uniref:Uncharacterized protein n=1 Tax=Phlyctema vagabunda TaxID=108571 RepID=A0ABR4PGG5_9HELO
MYLVPITHESPFCKNRTALLKALSNGKRLEHVSGTRDHPYIGEDCTYRWFPSPVICYILERFQSLTFIGGLETSASSAVYTALNILLREDVVFGGLLRSDISHDECGCAAQLANKKCTKYRITTSSQLHDSALCNGKALALLNSLHIPHLFIPITAPVGAQVVVAEESREIEDALFRSQTFHRPHPWQPSPVVVSLSAWESESAIEAELMRWLTLAAAAERNIPFLILGPTPSPSAGHLLRSREHGKELVDSVRRVIERQNKENVEFLDLWNLGLRPDVPGDAERRETIALGSDLEMALVQAMMVVNWLAMLETS